MPKFDNLPAYFEELKLKEDSTFSLHDLITQFKQHIPTNYLKIKLEEGNYGGLKKEEDITQPLYLDPKVLEKTETYKGITIENEKEIILVSPSDEIMIVQEIIDNLTNQVNTLVNQNAILSQISTSLTQWLTKLEKQQQFKYLQEQTQRSDDPNITARNKNFWNDLHAKSEYKYMEKEDKYSKLLLESELFFYGPTKGSFILPPHDKKFAQRGVKNVLLPTLIPLELLEKEKKHIAGFSPECFSVEKIGEKKIENALILPEKNTTPFFRNTEFLWQEGHTLHSSKKEARELALNILADYQDYAENTLCLGVIVADKEGCPFKIILGNEELKKSEITLVRRDNKLNEIHGENEKVQKALENKKEVLIDSFQKGEKAGKIIGAIIRERAEFHKNLYQKSVDFRDKHIYLVNTFSELKEKIKEEAIDLEDKLEDPSTKKLIKSFKGLVEDELIQYDERINQLLGLLGLENLIDIIIEVKKHLGISDDELDRLTVDTDLAMPTKQVGGVNTNLILKETIKICNTLLPYLTPTRSLDKLIDEANHYQVLNVTDNDIIREKGEIDKGKLEKLKNNQEKHTDYDAIKNELNKIKNLLGISSVTPLPSNWIDQLAKKSDLDTVKSALNKWTGKFLNKTPEQVEAELKKTTGTGVDLSALQKLTGKVQSQQELINKMTKALRETGMLTAEYTGNAAALKKIEKDPALVPATEKLAGVLEVKDIPELEEIDLTDEQVSELTVINCPSLKTIRLENNATTKIDFTKVRTSDNTSSGNPEKSILEKLYVGNNDIKEINFKYSSELKMIFLQNNQHLHQLTGLDELTKTDIINTTDIPDEELGMDPKANFDRDASGNVDFSALRDKVANQRIEKILEELKSNKPSSDYITKTSLISSAENNLKGLGIDEEKISSKLSAAASARDVEISRNKLVSDRFNEFQSKLHNAHYLNIGLGTLKRALEILGLPENSSKDKIKEAYRRLFRKYHTDKSPETKEKCQEIGEAKAFLENEEEPNKPELFTCYKCKKRYEDGPR
nr:10808_t:CDS:10 [Entrophospora candida]